MSAAPGVGGGVASGGADGGVHSPGGGREVGRGPAVDSVAAQVVRRARGLWRRAELARGVLVALALVVGAGVVLVLLDLSSAFPAPARRVLRLVPGAVGAIWMLDVLRRLVPGPADHRVALLVEERRPELEGLLSTALEPLGSGPVARAFRSRAASRLRELDLSGVAPLRARRPGIALAGALAVAALTLVFAPGGAHGVWERWAGLVEREARGLATMVAEPAAGLDAASDHDAKPEGDPGFGVVRVEVEPPPYTGLPAVEWSGEGVVSALPGSMVRVRGSMPAGVERVAGRVIGRGGGKGSDHSTAGDLPIHGAGGVRGEWSLAWRVARGDRGLSLEGRTGDDVVIHRVVPLALLEDGPPVVELEAPDSDLVVATPRGEVLIRGWARDDYGVGEFELAWIRSRGSGESFSFDEGRWRWDREVREGARIQGEYRLDLGAAGLEPGDVLHLRAVARDRNAVTGPGEGVSRTRVIRVAREEEMAEATTLIGFPLEVDREPLLSQRMVILLTERLLERAPSLSQDELLVEATEIAEEQARLRRRVGDQALAPTTGAADDHDDGGAHDHDADPVLAVNRPLLEAYNLMWSAEGELRIAELAGSLPYQYEALRILQEERQAERVFARGRVSVAPIDIAEARGTGELDEAAPAPRAAGDALPAQRAALAELEALIPRLARAETRDAMLELAGLAARILADRSGDPEVADLVARAAMAAEEGDGATALELTREARARLVPTGRVVRAARVATAFDPRSAAYLEALAGGNGGVDAALGPKPRRVARASGTAGAAGGMAGPFVFATVRYESGDWDSAPLVPANLIHAVAQYTEIPVAPEGVVVDLASSEIFRYPFLFLTGHLPVRFNDAESRNLEAYVERGGFIFIDDHNHDIDGAFHRTVTSELARIFGADALQPLPNDHELYRSFFIFEDGPPITSHELNGWGDGLIHEELFAIERGGRIGVLYSNKDYSSEWNYHAVNKRFLAVDNTRFGVNLIVYGLTR